MNRLKSQQWFNHKYVALYFQKMANFLNYSPLHGGTRIVTAFCNHKIFPRINKAEDHKRRFQKKLLYQQRHRLDKHIKYISRHYRSKSYNTII